MNSADLSGYLSTRTIGAWITGVGGSVSIFRVSGTESGEFLAALSQKSAEKFEHAKLTRVTLYTPGSAPSSPTPIDQALVAFFRAPHSFTGEDCVEFHCHGGSAVSEALTHAALKFGIRQALRGEFSFRAVKNGKMTLFQAQAVSDLITAKGSEGRDLALQKISDPKISGELEELKKNFIELMMRSELGIDFSDQDVEELSLPVLKSKAEQLLVKLRALSNSFERGSKIQAGIKCAIVGLPNSGKSSCFNWFLGKSRSIVSEYAGTTRDVIREELIVPLPQELGEGRRAHLIVADTAGLRDTAQEVEKIGIGLTQEELESSDLLILVIDGSQDKPDMNAINKLKDRITLLPKKASVVLVNKSDLGLKSSVGLKKWEPLTQILGETVNVSAKTGEGMALAAEKLGRICAKWLNRAPHEIVLTQTGHKQAVDQAVEAVERALGTRESDLFAADIRVSLHAMGPILGEVGSEEILAGIFGQFCIGK